MDYQCDKIGIILIFELESFFEVIAMKKSRGRQSEYINRWGYHHWGYDLISSLKGLVAAIQKPRKSEVNSLKKAWKGGGGIRAGGGQGGYHHRKTMA